MAVEERLESILSHVNRWLEFAEKKNGALLAGNSALILGVMSLLARGTSIHLYIRLYVYGALIFLAMAAVCCLISFLPQTRMPWIASRRKTSEEDNLLLYSDLADYGPSDMLSALCGRIGEEEARLGRFQRDYAEQVITNSRIALRKYRYFTVAVWLTLAAIVTPLGAGVAYLLLVKYRSKG